jgi:hypothetical protein
MGEERTKNEERKKKREWGVGNGVDILSLYLDGDCG